MHEKQEQKWGTLNDDDDIDEFYEGDQPPCLDGWEHERRQKKTKNSPACRIFSVPPSRHQMSASHIRFRKPIVKSNKSVTFQTPTSHISFYSITCYLLHQNLRCLTSSFIKTSINVINLRLVPVIRHFPPKQRTALIYAAALLDYKPSDISSNLGIFPCRVNVFILCRWEDCGQCSRLCFWHTR